MASEEELFEAIKDSLKMDGHIAKVQAELRARIIKILHNTEKTKPPEMTAEVNLLNDLIREYLDWNGYQYTSSVLCTESGMKLEKTSRLSMASQLGVRDDENTATLPLLLNIVSTYIERLRRHSVKH